MKKEGKPLYFLAMSVIFWVLHVLEGRKFLTLYGLTLRDFHKQQHLVVLLDI